MPDNIIFIDRATTDRDDLDFSALAALGNFQSYGLSNEAESAARLASAQIVLTNKALITARVMDAAPSLKLIQVVATGVNNIDLSAARERSLAVCNVAGYSTETVAQHVFACLLNLETNVHRFAAEPHRWAESPHFTRLDYPVGELAGQTMGIIGWGSIGKAVARIARAFGMEVVAYAREGSASHDSEVRRLAAPEFFAQADVISLHCPLTPETHHVICTESLTLMKTTALLINTGRGDLVDAPALVTALQQGTIRGAAIDVLTPEPPSADHPFLTANLENLFITPHTAWSSRPARQRLLDEIVLNIQAYRAGERRNRVD
jgi:glycerate dehydrogenase